ncbi:hypothetical protein PGN35_012705 [Nodosilinea sp. PGN35]|uniref:hypothetical protein n=1 Tax=Nodosilinea sp. PGN35 TaxID=3020489 RepID=UPI0023B293CC|nr:hypothetical protein [Nodosilinea sp. TSF1-S3]MDF0369208.1 hypothetical protein [Nodosilinea sp. TSF1-S3]
MLSSCCLLQKSLFSSGVLAIAFFATPAQADSPTCLLTKILELEAFDTELVAESGDGLGPAVDLAEIFAETLPVVDGATLPTPAELSFAAPLSQSDWSESTAQDLMPGNPELAALSKVEIVSGGPQETLAQVRPASDGAGWEFVIEPYIFVPFDVRTDISVGGITESVSVGLGDLFSLDRIFAGALRLEARQPRYGFFADLSHVYVREGRGITGFPLPPALASLATQQTGVAVPPGIPVDAAVRATGRTTTFDLGGYYRVVDQYLGRTEANQPTYPRLLVDPYLGLRVARLSGDLDFSFNVGGLPLNNVPLSQSATLVKPLLGGQLSLELSDRWAVGLRGSIAGLGIGADENFAWSLLAGARYQISPRTALQLAYQIKESRYSAGQGVSRFAVNQAQQGIWLGVDFGL